MGQWKKRKKKERKAKQHKGLRVKRLLWKTFWAARGQERENGRKRARFFKAVAEPHHFFAPLFCPDFRGGIWKERASTCGAFHNLLFVANTFYTPRTIFY